MLDRFVDVGDLVIDIGANIGHYTYRLSDLVGPSGRVVALEPAPVTFAILAANMTRFAQGNATLINAAATDAPRELEIDIPRSRESDRNNYYRAHVGTAGSGDVRVLGVPVDDLHVCKRVAMVKIDAEGHEAAVLRGMKRTLARDKPILILETESAEVLVDLEAIGYAVERQKGSPNVTAMVVS